MSDKVIDINRKRKNVKTNTAQQSRHKSGQTDGRRRSRSQTNVPEQDYSLYFIVFFLLAFGLVMLFSTSSYEAGINYGDTAYYLKKQLISTIGGVIAMLVFAYVDYRVWRRFVYIWYFLSLAAVILVQFIGTEVNGAKRWIYIGPVSVQPAEISKIAVILLTSFLICKTSSSHIKTFWGSVQVLWPCMLQAACILIFNRNLSTAAIVGLIGCGMFFIARRDYLLFFGAIGVVLAGAAGYVYYATHIASLSFRSDRVLAWLDPTKYADGTGFQILQGLYGIGSGGIFGKGLGESMQKLGYIPEAQNDMIFSIICEELGLFGAISIIVLFIILCWRFMLIATYARDLFGGMIASGVMIHIALQVILNIAVVSNTIPNTGVTLPFISYGGSSVIILLSEVGIVISVSRAIHKDAS